MTNDEKIKTELTETAARGKALASGTSVSPTSYSDKIAQYAGENVYTPGAAVTEAKTRLDGLNAGKPAAYTSKDADNLQSIYDQIMSRPAYDYTAAMDPVYRDYAEGYQKFGQTAKDETRGTVQGINGGYGDTWSQAVGNQQYGEYLKMLNDIVPGLEQNAYNAYNSEGDRLMSLYETTAQRDDTAYGRYRDSVADWQNDRNFAADQYEKAYARDYQQYSDAMNRAMTMTGWAREDSAQARTDAYNWALKLIQQGIMPNNDILLTAGIGMIEAKRLAKKYGYGKSSGGGGKKGSGGSGTTSSGSTTSRPVGSM